MRESQPVVAIVDDEQSVCRAIARLLRASRLDTQVYASGEAFLDSLHVHRPACVVLDLHMSGCSGHEVQKRLAAARIDVPVIIVTGRDDPGTRERCLADGAVAYLRKPLASEPLLAAIAAALERRRN